MVKVISDPYLKGGGGVYGTGLGEQLTSGVQRLANMKLQELHQQRQGQALQNLGMPAELASLPEPLQKLYVENQKIQQKFAAQQARQAGVSNQRQIDASSRKWNEGISKGYENALATVEDIREALQLLDTQKTRSGLMGLLPLAGSSAETRELDKVYNRLAGRLSSQSGVQTNAKIKFAQSQKPSLDQPIEAQRYLLESLLKEAQRPLQLGEIRDRLIAENDYQTPRGLEQRTLQEYNALRGMESSLQPDMGVQGQQQGAQPVGRSPQQEAPLATAGRFGLRTATNIGAGLAGAPGDILSAGLGLANYATGGAIPTYGEIQEQLPISIPTSENIKGAISKLTGGTTDPQSGAEQVMDSVFETLGSLVVPGKAAAQLSKFAQAHGYSRAATKTATKVLLPFTGLVPLKKALGVTAAGHLAKGAASALDLGPVGQGTAQLLAMTAAGTAGTRQQLDALMNAEGDAAKRLFKDQKMNVKPSIAKMDNYIKDLKGRTFPHKEQILPIAEQAKKTLQANSKSGTMAVNKLIEQKQDLNKYYKLALTEHVQGAKHLPEEARKELSKLIDIVKEPIAEASLKNKKAGDAFAIMEDIFRGTNAVDKAKQYFADNFSFKPGWSAPIKAIFSGGLGYIEAMRKLVFSNPQGKKFYFEAVKAAAEDDVRAFNKAVSELDKIAKKEKQ